MRTLTRRVALQRLISPFTESSRKCKYFLGVALFLLVGNASYSQCTPNVPFFYANLMGSPDSFWLSPSVVRDGDCCGSMSPDRCIAIDIMLDSGAVGIIFDIYSGAVPPGALYYQIDCGPQTQVGTPICLNTPGPHHLTFCKPGNNQNVYSIQSIKGPVASDDIDVFYQCDAVLYATGFTNSTLRWNSIYPGTYGAYNSYLDCTLGCDSPHVLQTQTLPAHIDFEVCGAPISMCGSTPTCDTVRVTFHPTVQASVTPNTALLCYEDSSVVLTANVSSGVPPYTYLWNTGATTQTITATGGTYWVQILDQRSCDYINDTAVITKMAEPVRAYTTADFDTCNAVNSISVSASVTGTAGGTWSGGTGSFSPSYTSLDVTYNISNADRANGYVDLIFHPVQTATNCPYRDDTTRVTLTGFTGTVIPVINNIPCYGLNNGSIQLSVSSGFFPYTFQWSTGSTMANIQNLPPGNYFVNITDANQCQQAYNYTITEPTLLAVSGSATPVNCFGGNTGSVSINIAGGTPNYAYQWSNGYTTQSISSLPAGVYNVTVRDANMCSVSGTYSVTQPTQLQIASSTVQAAGCYGANNGSIVINPSGGVSPYTFQWNNGSTSQNLGSVSAGTYSVTVLDQNLCSITASFVVSQPSALTMNAASVQNVTCYGANNGSIILNPSGGSFPYTYLWNTGAATINIGNLAQGIYNATVTDQNGCTVSGSYLVTAPAQLTINSSTVQDVNCYNGTDGSININVSGGNAPYTYMWSNGTTTANNGSLSDGTYSVFIYDQNYCSVTASYTVTQPAQLVLNSPSVVQPNCYGVPNGSIIANVSGGTPVYYYNWSNGGTAQGINNLPAGNYSLTVNDQHLCSATATYALSQPAQMQFNAYIQHESCFGNTNASITLNPFGGAGGYAYQWSNGATSIGISNLSPGSYSVTMTDAGNCSASTTFIVTQPAPLVLNPPALQHSTCYSDPSGSITANPSGGTSPYSYQWSNGGITQGIADLNAGIYNVTVYDRNICSATASYTITEPSPLFIDQTQTIIQNTSCFGGNNGTISISATGGMNPYTYQWSNGAFTQNVANLFEGNYTVTVVDNGNCAATATFYVPTAPEIIFIGSQVFDAQCYNGSDGRVVANVSGGTPQYNYQWSNGDSSSAIGFLAAGTYLLTVTDQNQCTASTSFTVYQPTAVAVNAAATVESCVGSEDGSILANANGGTPGYEFTLLYNHGLVAKNASGQFSPLAPSAYVVLATDVNGCVDSVELVLQPAVRDNYSVQVTGIECAGANNGSIFVGSVVLENAPHVYTLNNTVVSSSGVFTNLAPGDYVITATNRHGCDTTFTASITEPPAAFLQIVPDRDTISLGEPMQFSFIFGPYDMQNVVSYNWEPREGLSCYDCPNPVPMNYHRENNYHLTVVYNNGCEVKADAVVYVNAEYTTFVPNAFTPDNDGRDDYFKIYGNKDAWKTLEFTIFNRLGEKVFESNDIEFEWDGTFRGVPQNPAVFVYYARLRFRDEHLEEFKGSITLIK